MSAEAGINPTIIEDSLLTPPEIGEIDELEVVVDAYVDVLRAGRDIYDADGRDQIRAAAVSFGGLGNTEARIALLTARLLSNPRGQTDTACTVAQD